MQLENRTFRKSDYRLNKYRGKSATPL